MTSQPSLVGHRAIPHAYRSTPNRRSTHRARIGPQIGLSEMISALGTVLGGLPSSRTGLLPSSPLRTVHESFLSHSSSPSNASFGETRFQDRKVLAVNPVVALRMKEHAVFCAS